LLLLRSCSYFQPSLTLNGDLILKATEV
jgi:hypothetical protein